jgi:ATP-dependent Clp protease ATP-binding subunit ClpA
MFERYTERARQVIVLAQDEARAVNHNFIGTEHVLLGLLREEEGLAARVLESLDITGRPWAWTCRTATSTTWPWPSDFGS